MCITSHNIKNGNDILEVLNIERKGREKREGGREKKEEGREKREREGENGWRE